MTNLGRAKKMIMGSIDPFKLINYENIGMIVLTLFILSKLNSMH